VTAGAFGAARSMNPVVWLGAPAAMAVIGTVVLATPIKVFGLLLPQPVIPLALAFAWALIRPSVLPPFALLALGLFLDVFWGGPQGLWPLCLLTAYAATLSIRRLITGHGFAALWAWYAAASACAFFAGYLLTILASGAAPSLASTAWAYGWTLLLFPFAHRLIERYADADVRFR